MSQLCQVEADPSFQANLSSGCRVNPIHGLIDRAEAPDVAAIRAKTASFSFSDVMVATSRSMFWQADLAFA